MSHFERGSARHPIPPGESALAIEAGGPSIVPGPGGPGRRAMLRTASDGEVVIVKIQDADLTINGVRLGAEPTPLLHGDKVGVEGVELTFVDERRSGSTVFMAALEAPAAESGALAGSAAAGATAGRLVCLTDGREYTVGASTVVFGREAGCDIVIAAKDVSRRHAEILPTSKGYVLIDHSTNGTFVNDKRIPGQQLLSRGDVIRIGSDEFRFYAEESPRESTPRRAALAETLHGIPTAGPAPAAPAPPRAPDTPSPRAPPSPSAAAPRTSEAAAPPRTSAARGGSGAAPRPLASFLLREGEHKGTRLPVKSLVANVGRAEYNDVMLDDGSVSAQHAKLQRREGIWVLVDLESTNGTFVDEERVVGEAPLAPGSTVRFGDVTAIFEPFDEALGMGTGAPKTSLLSRDSVAALEERLHPSAGASPPPRSSTPAVPAAAEPVPVEVAAGAPPPAPPEPDEAVEPAPRPPAASGGSVERRGPASWGATPYRRSVGARRGERLRIALVGTLVVVAIAVTALILLLT